MQDQKKQQVAKFKNLNHQVFQSLFKQKWLKQLADYENTCQLILYHLTNCYCSGKKCLCLFEYDYPLMNIIPNQFSVRPTSPL